MSTVHVVTKKKVKGLGKKSFLNILGDLMLSEEEEQMMQLYYIGNKTMMQIAEQLGYSEIGIIKMHDRVLKKIAKVL